MRRHAFPYYYYISLSFRWLDADVSTAIIIVTAARVKDMTRCHDVSHYRWNDYKAWSLLAEPSLLFSLPPAASISSLLRRVRQCHNASYRLVAHAARRRFTPEDRHISLIQSAAMTARVAYLVRRFTYFAFGAGQASYRQQLFHGCRRRTTAKHGIATLQAELTLIMPSPFTPASCRYKVISLLPAASTPMPHF